MWARPRRTSTGSSDESSAQPMAAVSRSLRAPARSTRHSLARTSDVVTRWSEYLAESQGLEYALSEAPVPRISEVTFDARIGVRYVCVAEPSPRERADRTPRRRDADVGRRRRRPRAECQRGKSR